MRSSMDCSPVEVRVAIVASLPPCSVQLLVHQRVQQRVHPLYPSLFTISLNQSYRSTNQSATSEQRRSVVCLKSVLIERRKKARGRNGKTAIKVVNNFRSRQQASGQTIHNSRLDSPEKALGSSPAWPVGSDHFRVNRAIH